MEKTFWLEKDSPLKEKMLLSLDYYSCRQTGSWSLIAAFVILAVTILSLSFVYGR
jgi:hypothetical protein